MCVELDGECLNGHCRRVHEINHINDPVNVAERQLKSWNDEELDLNHGTENLNDGDLNGKKIYINLGTFRKNATACSCK
jgi:hypothetical protein